MDKRYTIILGENRSKTSTNSDTNLTFDIADNRRVLPEDTIVGKVDEYEQYIKEKDACTKFNMIFTMNVVASNVLFNRVSEIVYHEGSDDCIFFGRNGASNGTIPNAINRYNSYKGLVVYTNPDHEETVSDDDDNVGNRGKNILTSKNTIFYNNSEYMDTVYFAVDGLTVLNIVAQSFKGTDVLSEGSDKWITINSQTDCSITFNVSGNTASDTNDIRLGRIYITAIKDTKYYYSDITILQCGRDNGASHIEFKDSSIRTGYEGETGTVVLTKNGTTRKPIFYEIVDVVETDSGGQEIVKEKLLELSGSDSWSFGSAITNGYFDYEIKENTEDNDRHGLFVFKNVSNVTVGCLFVHQNASKENEEQISDATLKRYNMLRDTAYSHKDIGNLVYHCGYDIFSNHTLRKVGFNVINKINPNENWVKKTNFNTIADYNRDYDGNIIKDNISTIIYAANNGASRFKGRNALVVNSQKSDTHKYLFDSLLSINDTIYDKLIERNGWFGFINPSGMDIKNYGDISINKCMNNNKACEQIDMYPDRSLFYVVPKYNKYRHRVENNWDYCITFPYKNLYEHELVTSKKMNVNGLKTTLITRAANLLFVINNEKLGENGLDYKDNAEMMFSTDVSHNLSVGDVIEMWVKYSGETYEITTEIVSIGVGGDYTNNFFTINSSEFANIFSESQTIATDGYLSDRISKPREGVLEYGVGEDIENYVEKFEYGFIKWDNEEDEIRIAKVVRGKPCEYYIRLFKKLPNFKNTDAYADGIISDDELEKYSSNDFNSSLNNLAFSNNIYGDPIGQIVFNDDIDINGLKDNLGRDVSELYLTVIKTNKGYREWYDEKDYGSENVEFSHCFGKITAGFDFLPYSDDYNIHKLHNINLDDFKTNKFNEINPNNKYKEEAIANYFRKISNFQNSPKCLECDENGNSNNEITSNGDSLLYELGYGNDVFFGDIVEFSLYDVNETVLEKVNFRFNTKQREYTKDLEFYDFAYEEIIEDDYKLFDLVNGASLQPFKTSAVTYNINETKETASKASDGKYPYNSRYPFNIAPEGYYYSPHIRIPVREYSEDIKQGTHIEIKFEPANKIKDCDGIERWVTMNWDSAISNDWSGGTVFDIITAKNYYMNVGDRVFLYEIGSDGKKTIWGRVIEVSGRLYNHLTIRFDESVELYIEDGDIRKFKYKLFKYNVAKPSNAIEMNDGTGNYLWRPFLSESEMMRGNELYDRPFTNGKIYVHKFVDVFLRRQDPYNEYGLNCDDCSTKISDLTIYGEYKDVSMYESEEATQSKICASVVGDMFTDVASQLETRAKSKVSNFNIDKVINTYREKRKKAKEEAKAAAEANAQQGQG